MKVLPWLFPLIAVLAVFFLYRRGLMVTKSIRAVLFVFRPGREGDRATLDACTGWIRHACGLQTGRTYEFAFSDHLTRGAAEVLLLDGNRQTVLRLSRQNPAGRVEPEGNGRYSLRWEFQSASGRCELRW